MTSSKRPDQSPAPYDPEDDILLDAYAAADFLGGPEKPMSVGTLAVWRCTGRYDLPYEKIGRAVRYQKSVLRKFRNERRQSPK